MVVSVGVRSYMRRDTLMRILGVVRYVLVHVSVADDAYMQVRVRFQLFRVLGCLHTSYMHLNLCSLLHIVTSAVHLCLYKVVMSFGMM